MTVLVLSSCDSSPRGPYVSNGEQQRNPAQAETLYREAIAQLSKTKSDSSGDKDRLAAESMLREALSYDLYHGPAHNNLGVLLLKQERLYDAAEEFEWARKLLPGNPEPRVNLAIALERGGKHVDAIDAAKAALEVSPGNLAAMQTIALVQVREGMTDSATNGLLAQIRSRSMSTEWQDWAARTMMRRSSDSTNSLGN